MPHYWFDLSDNGSAHPDPDGLDLDSLDQARTDALRGLAEMARDHKPIANERELTITVRDGDGPVYRMALVIRCEAVRS